MPENFVSDKAQIKLYIYILYIYKKDNKMAHDSVISSAVLLETDYHFSVVLHINLELEFLSHCIHTDFLKGSPS